MGPLWLKDNRIAEEIVRKPRSGQRLKHYSLNAYVVMANHVHVLLTPKLDVHRITNSLKGTTAREPNRLLGRTGQPFWCEESFDRWIRDDDHFVRTKAYIERNPVKAHLVEKPEEWKWPSAHSKAK